VRIELDAEDARGVPAPTAKSAALVPALPTLVEQRIVPAAGAGPAMVFQAGNAGFEYVFGGRRELDGSRSFHVTIPENALRSFYLDAREVSAGEYRAFVEDPGGYREPRNWPAGDAPREERRLQLAGMLPDGRAVSGVTWAEAWAFARWRGKRLPSLLEWEYVVRGGREYRAASDESGARGVTGLCAAPFEWTSTPQDLVAGASDFSAQCRANIALLLAPDENAFRDDTHWVAAGPTWEDALLRSSRAERSYPDVGFRCAVDAELAWTWLDQGRFRVKE
jgi:hypothetical protein